MIRDDIRNDYFEWLFELVSRKRFAKAVSYRKLLSCLHDTDFTWTYPLDQNRAVDGMSLRYRFALHLGYEDDSELITDQLDDRPCSVLEMMVALAMKCEETIMDDPRFGDRMEQWFWNMVVNLGLGSMTDDRFDRLHVDDTIAKFLNHEYKPDGRGGLFTIRNYHRDLRDMEIWHQLCGYLNSHV